MTASVNLPRMFDPKKVGEVAVVVTIVNHEVGKFAWLERANLIASVERTRRINRGGCD